VDAGAKSRRQLPDVGAEHDLGVEQGEQPIEVSRARGGQKGVDELALQTEVGIRLRRLALNAPPGAAGELACRRR